MNDYIHTVNAITASRKGGPDILPLRSSKNICNDKNITTQSIHINKQRKIEKTIHTNLR